MVFSRREFVHGQKDILRISERRVLSEKTSKIRKTREKVSFDKSNKKKVNRIGSSLGIGTDFFNESTTLSQSSSDNSNIIK